MNVHTEKPAGITEAIFATSNDSLLDLFAGAARTGGTIIDVMPKDTEEMRHSAAESYIAVNTQANLIIQGPDADGPGKTAIHMALDIMNSGGWVVHLILPEPPLREKVYEAFNTNVDAIRLEGNQHRANVDWLSKRFER